MLEPYNGKPAVGQRRIERMKLPRHFLVIIVQPSDDHKVARCEDQIRSNLCLEGLTWVSYYIAIPTSDHSLQKDLVAINHQRLLPYSIIPQHPVLNIITLPQTLTPSSTPQTPPPNAPSTSQTYSQTPSHTANTSSPPPNSPPSQATSSDHPAPTESPPNRQRTP